MEEQELGVYDSEGYWSLKSLLLRIIKTQKVNKFYVFIPSPWDDRS